MRRNDAVAIGLLSLLASIICLAPLPDWALPARVVAALLLALVLPGFATIWAIFPRHSLALSARVLLTLSVSVCITALLGYLLNFTGPGLQRSSWAIALGYYALLASVLAMLRLRESDQLRARLASVARYKDKPVLLRISGRARLLFALAAVITIVAFTLDHISATRSTGHGFTQLWLLPAGTDSVRLGIENHEGVTTHYRLELTVADSSLAAWPRLSIGSGRRWTGTVKLPAWLPGGVELQAAIYRADSAGTIYRRVSFWTGP